MTTLNLLFGFLLALNLATFFVYGSDKLAAIAHTSRVRERTLLILALLGGSIGALLAMKLFRHKTIKPIFGMLLALILVLQIAIIYLFFPHLTNSANRIYYGSITEWNY